MARLRRDDRAAAIRVRIYGQRTLAGEQEVFLERKIHREAWTGEQSCKVQRQTQNSQDRFWQGSIERTYKGLAANTDAWQVHDLASFWPTCRLWLHNQGNPQSKSLLKAKEKHSNSKTGLQPLTERRRSASHIIPEIHVNGTSVETLVCRRGVLLSRGSLCLCFQGTLFLPAWTLSHRVMNLWLLCSQTSHKKTRWALHI